MNFNSYSKGEALIDDGVLTVDALKKEIHYWKSQTDSKNVVILKLRNDLKFSRTLHREALAAVNKSKAREWVLQKELEEIRSLLKRTQCTAVHQASLLHNARLQHKKDLKALKEAQETTLIIELPKL